MYVCMHHTDHTDHIYIQTIHTYTHTYIHTYIQTIHTHHTYTSYTPTHMHIHTYISYIHFVCVSTLACLCVCFDFAYSKTPKASTHTYIHIYIHTYIHTKEHIMYIQYTHTHAYIHMQQETVGVCSNRPGFLTRRAVCTVRRM